jgi:DNA polymerase III subunit delta'
MGSWPVVGHEWATGLLERAITGGRLRHAHLFSGPEQVGKTTVAMAFAQALLCDADAGFPCGQCRSCQRVAAGRHPDVQTIAAGKNAIQIEQIRLLQADAALLPLEGRRRIFIIQEIERASLPAANALLKTLEEPPPQVVLLLTCSHPDQLLPTIVSRCQIIALRPLPLEEIRATLETRWQADPERSALLARLSSGRLGWAVAALSDSNLWRLRAKSFDDLLSLTTADHFGRLVYTESLSRSFAGGVARGQEDALPGSTISIVLEFWVSWWRDIWMIQQGVVHAIANLDRRLQLGQQAALFTSEQVEGALTDLMDTLRRLRVNVNARLALDVLVLRIPTAIVA